VAGPDRPLWWPLFIAAERAVGSRLERATRSEEFATAVTRLAQVEGALRSAYVRATAAQLHRANLPAWSDLRRLGEQVTALERRVADLAVKIERASPAKPRPRSTRRPPRSSDR
jgi:hypothetical protein